jgi:hypothetical protein
LVGINYYKLTGHFSELGDEGRFGLVASCRLETVVRTPPSLTKFGGGFRTKKLKKHPSAVIIVPHRWLPSSGGSADDVM